MIDKRRDNSYHTYDEQLESAGSMIMQITTLFPFLVPVPPSPLRLWETEGVVEELLGDILLKCRRFGTSGGPIQSLP